MWYNYKHYRYFQTTLISELFPKKKGAIAAALTSSKPDGSVKWAQILCINPKLAFKFIWSAYHIDHMWTLVKYNISLKIDKLKWTVSNWQLFKFRISFSRSHPNNQNWRVDQTKAFKLKYRIIKLHIEMIVQRGNFSRIFYSPLKICYQTMIEQFGFPLISI